MKNLTDVKKSIKRHRNEIFAYSVAAVSLGAAVYIAHKKEMFSSDYALMMTKEDVKMITSGEGRMRYETKAGTLVVQSPNHEM